MNIYIDESGNFAREVDGSNAPSIVAALVLPHLRSDEVFRRFRKLKRRWGYGSDEAKGRKLPPEHIRSVIALLLDFDALVFMLISDLALESEKVVAAAKAEQAARFVATLTPEHKPGMVRDMTKWKNGLERLRPQLWVQFALMLQLIPDVLEMAPVFHVTRTLRFWNATARTAGRRLIP